MTRQVALTALLTALCLPGSAGAQEAEPILMFSMLRNGDFSLPPEPRVVAGGVPWWLLRGASCSLHEVDGQSWLLTEKDGIGYQPLPAYAPMTEGLVIRGRVRGVGRIALIDGEGRRAQYDCGAAGEPVDFEWRGAAIRGALGSAPLPRMTLVLGAVPPASAGWTDLEVLVPLPCPSEKALRAEIVRLLHATLDPWIERGIDGVGPRRTGLVCHIFDAVTGERTKTQEAGYHPLIETLFDAVRHEPDPLWVAALERYIEDFLTLLIHPQTGLPRMWNCEQDVPLDERFLEIHAAFRFLLDIAERGPAAFRARALAAAEKLAESALASGVLPDGNVAPLYRPSDGASSNEARVLRRLDVPLQMTRLAALNGDARLLEAARDAVATLLYMHYWPGSWNRIDPGFDDDFGHYAARAAAMAQSFPEEVLFRRVVDSGWERYRELWPQALRFGGSMAADQVRCWKLLLEYSDLRPQMRPELGELLVEAVHSHLRGQQYGNGAWGDVTYYGYQPVVDLQVGDLPGTPSNLLEGLATIYGSGLGPSEEELRALFTAVLRSSVETYGREFGLLSTMRESDGRNDAGGSLRIGPALTLMLAQLGEG